MNSSEIDETYRDLMAFLSETGFAWIVAQVEEAVAAGIPIERSVKIIRDEFIPRVGLTLAFHHESAPPRRAGKPTQMMSIEELTPAQRLELLIDALRHAIVHAIEMEQEGLSLLVKTTSATSVTFTPEVDGDDRRTLVWTSDVPDEVPRLNKALSALSLEINR